MKRITKKNNKKNTKLLIILILIVIIIFLIVIRNIPTIRNIEIIIENSTIGNELTDNKITKELIMEYSNIKIGDKLYSHLRSEIEENIEKNPYIKSAKIERNLSGLVRIVVSQRNVSYMINYSGEFIYLDNEGYVLELNSNSKNVPIIIGFLTDFSEMPIGNSKGRINKSDLDKLESINLIIDTLKNNEIDNTINSIDVTNSQNIILHLEADGKEVYLGDVKDINTKVLYMKKILEVEAGNTGIIYINGNLDEGYVYFKEQ